MINSTRKQTFCWWSIRVSQQQSWTWMKLFCPMLVSAFSCIVCLHQATPQKPSLPLQSSGVWPHLPTSEFVCADELWAYSSGVSFLGNYKGPYSDWEASTKLSHNNYLVSQRFLGEGSWHSKHPSFPTAPHTPTINLPVPPDPLASPHNQTKGRDPNMKAWLEDLEYVFLTPVHGVYIVLE